MEGSCKTAVATAVAGGYLLGRTKKAKLALGLVMLVAGKRLKLAPADLAAAGMRQVTDNVEFAALRDQLRDQLLGGVKTAAGAAMDRQVASLLGSLRERSESLSGLGDTAEPAGGDEHEGEEATAHEDEHDEKQNEDQNDDGDGEPEEQKKPAGSKKHTAQAPARSRSTKRDSEGVDHKPPRRSSREEPKRAPAKRASSSRSSSRSGR